MVDARRPGWLRLFAQTRASHGDLTRGSLVPIRGPRAWREPRLLQLLKEGSRLIRTHVVHAQLYGALDEEMKVCAVDRFVPVNCVGGGWVVFVLAWEHWKTPGQG